jgi:hypothetical protein
MPEGGEASRALGVEKHTDEEPSGHRFLQWVVRHPGWSYGGGVSPVEETGVIRAPGVKHANDHVTVGGADDRLFWITQNHGLPRGYGGQDRLTMDQEYTLVIHLLSA